MSIKKVKAVLKNQANTELTLLNDKGEKFTLGYATEVIPYQTKVKFRWPIDGKADNVFPFTHAILHSGKTVINGFSIKPVQDISEASKLELIYDYE